jgi:hypothetical protein
VPRAIVDLPTDDQADIILIGGLAANDFVPQPSAGSTTVEITPIQDPDEQSSDTARHRVDARWRNLPKIVAR